MRFRDDEKGVGMLELLLTMAIASILSVVLLSISLTYIASVMRNKITADLAIESHFALQNIVEDIRLADSIATTPVITDPNEPMGGWATNDANNVLILNSPATDAMNNIIYNPDTGAPYQNQIIYFKNETRLYKRILKNPDAPGNTAQTTCPEFLMSATCPSDRMYSTNLQDIGFVFSTTNNQVTTDPAMARSVRFTMLLSRKVSGENIRSDNTIQATLRNF